jgi:hypothetical protein
MALRIVLDGPRTATFSAEDIVKGRVILQSQKDEAISQVSIAFMGLAKTKLYRRQHADNRTHKSQADYFYFSKKLYQGHYTLRANTYEWPFEFRFPSQTDPKASANAFTGSPPFRSSLDVHPLPPTFSHNGSSLNRSFEGFIEYKLEATLVRHKIFASNLESTLALKYMSYRSAEHPPLVWRYTKQTFTAQTLRLLPEKSDVKLSMKEKMRSAFKSSELPRATFSLKMRYPTQIHSGDQPSIHLSVQHLGSNCPENPTIFLKYVTMNIKTTVHVRAPGLAYDHHDSGSRNHQILGRYGLSNELPESIGLPPEDSSQDIERWLNLNANGGMNIQTLQLNLDTYNIAVSNRLDIKIKVSCADKLFEFSNTLPIVVLPPAFAAHSATIGEAVEIGVLAEIVPPPLYEHVPEYQEIPS